MPGDGCHDLAADEADGLEHGKLAAMAAHRSEQREPEPTDCEYDQQTGEHIREGVDAGQVADLAAGIGVQHLASESLQERAAGGAVVDARAVADGELECRRTGLDAFESGQGGDRPAREAGREVAGCRLERLADDPHPGPTVAHTERDRLPDVLVRRVQRVGAEGDFVRCSR